MNDKQLEVLNDLNNAVNAAIRARIEVASAFAASDIDLLLSEFKDNFTEYQISVGYYNDQGFQVEHKLNTSEFLDGHKIVDYLIKYYDDNDGLIYLSHDPTVALIIKDRNSNQEYYLEYTGINLIFDLQN